DFAEPFVTAISISAGRLPLRITADVAGGVFNRLLQFGGGLLPGAMHLVFGDAEWIVLAQSVPTRGVAAKSAISVAADVLYDAADGGLDIGQIGRAAPG